MSNQQQSEARQLRAAGVPITLLDGRQVRLLFDLEALAQVEEDFGSLGGMQEALQAIDAEGMKTAFFRPILKMIRAALVHDPSAANAQFDTALVGDYFKAVMEATQLAFPKEQATTTARANPVPVETLTPSFPGEPSTTSAPSASVEPTPSSGA